MDLTLTELVEDSVKSRGIEPLVYVLSGSRGYGLNSVDSDWDIVGVHISPEILEHPRHRVLGEVQEWKGLVSEDGIVSIVSYEAWKFIDMLKKGAFVAWEIGDMDQVFTNDQIQEFHWELAYSHHTPDVTSAFVYSAIGNAKSDMFAEELNRKKVMMGYFRLCQAGCALIEGDVKHNKSVITKFNDICVPIPLGKELLSLYLDEETRREPLDQVVEDHARKEVASIISWLENRLKSSAHTTLHEDRLQGLLRALKKDRIGLVKEMK